MLSHYVAADRHWLYFLLSACFNIPGIGTLSAKSLAALPAYWSQEVRAAFFRDVALGIGFGKALVRLPTLVCPSMPRFLRGFIDQEDR